MSQTITNLQNHTHTHSRKPIVSLGAKRSTLATSSRTKRTALPWTNHPVRSSPVSGPFSLKDPHHSPLLDVTKSKAHAYHALVQTIGCVVSTPLRFMPETPRVIITTPSLANTNTRTTQLWICARAPRVSL